MFDRKVSQRFRLAGVGLLVAMAAVATGMRAEASANPIASLSAELTAAATQSTIPSNVDPPLATWTQAGLQASFSYPSHCFADRSVTSVPVNSCWFGNRSARRTIVLLGDSQAYQWLPDFDVWGKAANWKVLVLDKASCRPWPSSRYLWSDHASTFPQCASFNAWADATINKLKPTAVVVSGMIGNLGYSTLESSSDIVRGMQQLKHALSPSRSRFIVLQNIPWFWGVPSSPSCLLLHPSHVDLCAQHRDIEVNQFNVNEVDMASAITQLTSLKIAAVVDVQDLVCAPTSCPMLSRSRLIYQDDAHITRQWALHVEPAFAELMATTLG